MQNLLNEAVHEFSHAIDGGADYNATVQHLAQYFGVSTQELENAYHNYVMSL